MMHHEFEELAGYEVTVEDYDNIIEPMYMAINVSKQEFVKMIDKKRFALPTKRQMINEMKKIAEHLYDICGRTTDYESEQKLEKLAKIYAKRFYGLEWANDMYAYVFFNKGYEFPHLERGCTYPKELVIGRDKYEYARVALIKE